MTRMGRIGIALLLGSGLVILIWQLSGGRDTRFPEAPERTGSPATMLTPDGLEERTPEEPPASEREAVEPPKSEPAPPFVVALDETDTRDRAVLIVKVVRKDTAAPLRGIEVGVEGLCESAEMPPEWVSVSRHLTNSAGLAAMEVPARTPLVAYAEDRVVQRHDGPALETGHAWEEDLFLTPGSRREITLEVPVGTDLLFWGHVVSEDGHPVPGTEIWWEEGMGCHLDLSDLDSDATRLAESDDDGLFHVRLRSWVDNCLFAVAPGLVPVRVGIEEGHDGPERATTIVLPRGARLTVSLQGPTELIEQLELRAGATEWDGDGYYASSIGWAGYFDDEGRCRFGGLPAGIPLSVELRADGRTYRRCEEEIELSVGEDRLLHWVVGDGATIGGRLLDQHERLVTGCTVWLIDGGAMERAPKHLQRPFPEVPYRDLECRTDADGRFRFEDLPPGGYWIGPHPEHDDRSLGGRVESDWAAEIPAVAEFVMVDSPSDRIEFDLHVQRGHLIRGRVVKPDGSPAEDAWISAWNVGSLLSFGADTDDDGEFELGPLLPGDYVLRAWSTWLAGSEEVSASVRRRRSGSIDQLPGSVWARWRRTREVGIVGVCATWSCSRLRSVGSAVKLPPTSSVPRGTSTLGSSRRSTSTGSTKFRRGWSRRCCAATR